MGKSGRWGKKKESDGGSAQANAADTKPTAVASLPQRKQNVELPGEAGTSKCVMIENYFSIDEQADLLKKNLANKIFGYLARCEFWAKLGLRFWILVGYVDFLVKFDAKSDFRV